MTFSRSTYYTIEEDKFLQFALEFTNPSAFDIKITITASDLTATGVCIHIIRTYMYIYAHNMYISHT